MKKIEVLVITLITVLFVAGIFTLFQSNELAESTARTTLAPDFTLKDVYGEDFTLSEHRGKIIVLDFMATWCSWCLKLNDALRAVKDRFGEDVLIVSICINLDEKDILSAKRLMESEGIDWILLIGGSKLIYKYNVKVLPTTFIIGGDGRILAKIEGYVEANQLIELIEENLSD